MIWRHILTLAAAAGVLSVLTRRILARRKRMLDWPIVPAKFRSGTITALLDEGWEPTKFRLRAEFSYGVGGSEYAGESTESSPASKTPPASFEAWSVDLFMYVMIQLNRPSM